MAVDYVYRLEQPHVAGQLARVCQTIADSLGLIGDVVTVQVGRDRSIREISVEVRDHDQAIRVRDALEALDGVSVISFHDRAVLAHEGGKLAIEVRNPVTTLQQVRDIYTPGVARVCTAIAESPQLANRLTMIGRTVAICTNGTRVLGLGNIGAVASMPVMEGKALFYRQMAGISAMPILIDTEDPEEFIETVLRIAPGFGAIHLEDIKVPDCFEIESRLIEALDIPVMHDDVHGTAVATLAAALAACDQVGIKLEDSTVGQVGLGAAGLGIAALMVEAGASRVIASDPDERSHERARARGIESASFDEVMAGARIVVATTGQPGLITPEHVREGQVVFALTNPDPEITPTAALEAGAAFAADGASVNNVLGYPGIFRGALLSGAEEINLPMKLAAAETIASLATGSEL
nr:NAD-dependent malic enzyme [Actinomycetota bacterium]